MNSPEVKSGSELIKALGELIKSAGPTDEQRQAFGRTFFGTLLGQTVVLIGTILVYLSAIALIWRYWSEGLKIFHSDVGEWFWLILGAPFICILLFSMLPTAWLARRERRLKTAAITGDTHFDATNFRLYPFQEADRASFSRLDGADRRTLHWLASTRASLLYFSGASGVGKSSLLAASVLPQLRDKGWTVIEIRLLGDPIERLRAVILNFEPRLAKKDGPELALRDLLTKATDDRGRKGSAPLLLVIDQFEEYLIAHKNDDRGAFSAFLSDLARLPINRLQLLLVFRSDYRPLVFKLDLPPLVAGQNWHELSAYDRDEAMALLRNGGRELSAEAFNRLFRGLDQIDDTPGMYRLITLNMVGLVLERMGRALEGDAGRLIQAYLRTCLTTSESRDFAKPLLARMITDAGTKEPRSEAELAKDTGFTSWQVKATLAELSRHGLVRQSEAATTIWEIAHDFLARLIGQLIGRLKPSLSQRLQPLLAPTVLVGWIALAIVALPSWKISQEREAEAALRQLGAQFGEVHDGLGVQLRVKSDGALIAASRHFKKLGYLHVNLILDSGFPSFEPLEELTNVKSLSISAKFTVKSLEPLKGLTKLVALDLDDDTGLSSLEPLKELTNLEALRFWHLMRPEASFTDHISSLEPLVNLTKLSALKLTETRITSLEPLKSLTNLSELDLSDSPSVMNLEPLANLTKLTTLSLTGSRITSLEPLKSLTNLSELDLSSSGGITSLEPLKDLTNLTSLEIQNTGVRSLEPLKRLTNLSSLRLGLSQSIWDLEPLKGLTHLSKLDLSNSGGVTSLEPLKSLTSLSELDISGNKITSLEPLKSLTNLTSLDISYNDIRDVEPLRGLTNLSSLGLRRTDIATLAPLKGLRIAQITGASAQLLATMK